MNEVVVMFALKLMFVKEVHENDAGAAIVFDGRVQGRLTGQKNPNYADYLQYARQSLRDRSPVAVAFDQTDHIVTMYPGLQGIVDRFAEYDAKRLRIGFTNLASYYYLGKDHPDFHRIHAVLEHSLNNHSWVWLSAERQRLADVVPLARDGKQ
jgi:hypothetical protein